MACLELIALLVFVTCSFATTPFNDCAANHNFTCENGNIPLNMVENITDDLLKSCELGIYMKESQHDVFKASVNSSRPLTVKLKHCPSEFYLKMDCDVKTKNINICFSAQEHINQSISSQVNEKPNHRHRVMFFIPLGVFCFVGFTILICARKKKKESGVV